MTNYLQKELIAGSLGAVAVLLAAGMGAGLVLYFLN
jgi:hypothetical protein